MSQDKKELQAEKSSFTNEVVTIVESEEEEEEDTKDKLVIDDFDSTSDSDAFDNDRDSVEKKVNVKKEEEPFTLCLVDEGGGVLETYVRVNDEMVPVEGPQPGPPPKKKRKGRPPKVVSRRAVLKKKLSRQRINGVSLNKEVFCEHCNLGFNGFKEFQLHLRKQHINVNAHGYICCHCGYQVGLLMFGHISRHVRQIHCCKSDRRHSCSECGVKFFEYKDLIRHMHIHTPHGPFECAHCNYSHTSKSALNKHLKSHGFKTSSSSDSNDFPDEPYQCDYCGYKTLYKTCLAQHIDRHLGIRRFKCNECEFNTYSMSDLQKHRTSHSTVRAYGCDLCSKTYKRRSHLTTHMDHKHLKSKKV